jgi:translation initiation factor 6 (eIF-6)
MDKDVAALGVVGLLAVLTTVGIVVASKKKNSKEEKFDDTKDIPVNEEELGI